MKGEILFLCHRIPFPPDRGDKIRSYHILKRLAEIAPLGRADLVESVTSRYPIEVIGGNDRKPMRAEA